MKIRRSFGFINVELTSAEAAVLFDELETVRGGARMPKMRQLCMALGASVELDKPPERNKGGALPGNKNRAKKTAEARWGIIPQVAAMKGAGHRDEDDV